MYKEALGYRKGTIMWWGMSTTARESVQDKFFLAKWCGEWSSPCGTSSQSQGWPGSVLTSTNGAVSVDLVGLSHNMDHKAWAWISCNVFWYLVAKKMSECGFKDGFLYIYEIFIPDIYRYRWAFVRVCVYSYMTWSPTNIFHKKKS